MGCAGCCASMTLAYDHLGDRKQEVLRSLIELTIARGLSIAKGRHGISSNFPVVARLSRAASALSASARG